MTAGWTNPSRRQALGMMGAAGGALMLAPGLTLAAAPTEKRFVFFVLRGAMDGLAALAPVGDPGLDRVRGPFMERTKTVPLDGFFALHAELAPLKPLYDAGEFLPIHAVASSHRGRSHFEAQDVLEAGLAKPNSSTSGWLNRVLAEYETRGPRRRLGLAVGPRLPLALRGPVAVNSAAPDTLPGAPGAYIDRILTLWNNDPLLGPALDVEMPGGDQGAMPRDMARGGNGAQAVVELAHIAAGQLAHPDGSRIAVIELDGFDTHSAEANRLDQQFRALSLALLALKDGLRAVWRDTVILAVSEFGRTAAPNGSGGTDHGTAGAGFLLGGAVKGGRVLADWPGLQKTQLFEGRDLAPTLHIAALYKSIAATHLGLDGREQLARLFPDAGRIGVADIIRA